MSSKFVQNFLSYPGKGKTNKDKGLTSFTEVMKKALGEMQTLRAGHSNAEPKIFATPQTPFPGAQ